MYNQTSSEFTIFSLQWPWNLEVGISMNREGSKKTSWVQAWGVGKVYPISSSVTVGSLQLYNSEGG